MTAIGEKRKAGKNRKNKVVAVLKRREQVGILYCQGLSQRAIALKLDCGLATVNGDLAKLRQTWQRKMVGSFNQRLSEELAKLDYLESQAWRAWERSCKDTETTKVRKADDKTTAEKTAKTSSGDPRFLAEVRECVTTRLKLMGLLTSNTNINTIINTGGKSWEEIMGVLPSPQEADEEGDVIENKLNEYEETGRLTIENKPQQAHMESSEQDTTSDSEEQADSNDENEEALVDDE